MPRRGVQAPASEGGHWVLSRRKIVRNYATSWFLIDLLTVIDFQARGCRPARTAQYTTPPPACRPLACGSSRPLLAAYGTPRARGGSHQRKQFKVQAACRADADAPRRPAPVHPPLPPARPQLGSEETDNTSALRLVRTVRLLRLIKLLRILRASRMISRWQVRRHDTR